MLYHFIIWCCCMSRTLKPSPLKFDTSLANITCFIRGKSTQPKSRSRKKQKPKKSQKQKPVQFQDRAFLQSVVCRILNQGDCQGITELIDNMVFPNSSNESESNRQEEEMRMRQIFSNQEQRPQEHLRNIYPSEHARSIPPQEMYRIITPQQSQHQKRQCTTMMQSGDSSILGSPRQQTNPELIAFQQYQQYYALYGRGPPQRKRRQAQNEQVLQYSICQQKLQQDGRTTIMIRHIPNKYSEEMLWQQIGRNHRLKINFLYLPIDHFNACNVGYAFVNFIHTKFIGEFFQEFNGRRWDRFNSEKICQLAYARIQGTTNLMDHYQNPKKQMKDQRKTQKIELDQDAIKDIGKILDGQRVEDF